MAQTTANFRTVPLTSLILQRWLFLTISPTFLLLEEALSLPNWERWSCRLECVSRKKPSSNTSIGRRLSPLFPWFGQSVMAWWQQGDTKVGFAIIATRWLSIIIFVLQNSRAGVQFQVINVTVRIYWFLGQHQRVTANCLKFNFQAPFKDNQGGAQYELWECHGRLSPTRLQNNYFDVHLFYTCPS